MSQSKLLVVEADAAVARDLAVPSHVAAAEASRLIERVNRTGRALAGLSGDRVVVREVLKG